MFIDDKTLLELKSGKNLLALSCGVDSTALFFMMLEKNVEFDIAIVNYNVREAALLEIEYAKELANRYKKNIFIKSVELDKRNFEANARELRYSFFEEIIKNGDYSNLILAHQLNDLFEWFLMQFSKGAGLKELIGMKKIEKRDGYNIIRAILDISREKIEEYLKSRGIKYFEDSSNFDTSIRRNSFRHNFSNEFLKLYGDGVKRSFEYLQKDCLTFEQLFEYENFRDLYILKRVDMDGIDIRNIDTLMKKLGVLLSSKQRDEVLEKRDCVVGGKIAIVFGCKHIFIAPFISTIMEKEFKERCRVLKIPPKIRGYIYKNFLLDELILWSNRVDS